MYHFQVTLHARPKEATPGPQVEFGGVHLPTLQASGEALARTPFACTFEEAAANLLLLPRMDVEADGALVWVSSQHDIPWQVDGNLFDGRGRLLFVDLKGSCPADAFDLLLGCLGWPATSVVFHVVRLGLLLDEAAFRVCAAAAEPNRT